VAGAPVRIILTGALLILLAGSVHADDRLWILTGDVYKDDYYFGGGLIIPFWGNNHLGNGWVQRYWLDTFSYTYDAGGRDIDANVFGAEAMVGYQASRPGLSGAAYFGVRYSNAHLSPDDPGGALRGEQFWPKAQLEGEAQLSPAWRLNGIVAYTFILDGYWTRLRLLYGLSGGKYIGPEVVVQGDPNYNAQKIGVAFGGIEIASKVFLTLKGGYRFQSGADSPYIGAELVGEF
jgi:hypothetical protein